MYHPLALLHSDHTTLHVEVLTNADSLFHLLSLSCERSQPNRGRLAPFSDLAEGHVRAIELFHHCQYRLGFCRLADHPRKEPKRWSQAQPPTAPNPDRSKDLLRLRETRGEQQNVPVNKDH